jgi:3-oxoacyl-[acyl-carrier protein] reductase
LGAEQLPEIKEEEFMNYGLKERFALVTGGSHGIGLSTAKALLAEGCRVCICSRSEQRLQEAKAH